VYLHSTCVSRYNSPRFESGKRSHDDLSCGLPCKGADQYSSPDQLIDAKLKLMMNLLHTFLEN
jgi:hypothetical protein